jgi:AraC family transcriptional regulator, transcriptional activator of pobA
MSVQIFTDINASHAATGYAGRTDLPGFHIFTVEDTYPSTRQVMPPYSFRFYQVVLLENSGDASLNMNEKRMDDLSDSLSFASPDHVLAWTRGAEQHGYILYFKPDFLAHHPRLIEDEFPFFRLTEINFVYVSPADKQQLRDHFARLLDMFRGQHPYRVPMLQALLLILLFDCKHIYEKQERSQQGISPQHALAHRFQQFVNQHYLTRKTVQAYAELLHVSPDYLGEAVKTVTGKTPIHLISDRILLEAQKLLLYTDLSVAEIAHYLGYAESTHFGRFFRRHTGSSPHVWRRQQ